MDMRCTRTVTYNQNGCVNLVAGSSCLTAILGKLICRTRCAAVQRTVCNNNLSAASYNGLPVCSENRTGNVQFSRNVKQNRGSVVVFAVTFICRKSGFHNIDFYRFAALAVCRIRGNSVVDNRYVN